MLLFRDEEHVQRWCRQWRLREGAILPLDSAWRLAQAWFGADRGAPEWARPSPSEVRSLFDTLGLNGDFWRLA